MTTAAVRLVEWRLKPTTRYLILARVSTKKQDSEAQQLDACRADVRDNLHGGTPEIEERLDHGVSGLNEHRLDEIVAECERNPGTASAPKFIIVYDGSRFSRLDSISVNHYKYLLRKAHWQIRSVTEPDSDDPGMSNTMGAMRQEQHAGHTRMLKLKVKPGMLVSVRLGCWVGRPPFGYAVPKAHDKRTQKLVIVPEQAKTVKRIFQRYADGASFASIAQELNTAKVPGPFTRFANLGSRRKSSGLWRSCSIRKMLGQVVYRGVVEWGGERTDGAHPEIIDRALWNRVQARLKRPQPRRRPAGENSQPYILSGLLTCETCHGKVRGGGGANRHTKDPTRYQVYVCPNSSKREIKTCDGRTLSINQRWLEGTVCEHVGRQVAKAVKSGALAKALDDVLGTRSDVRDSREKLEAKRDDLKARKLRLMEFGGDADAKARVAELNTELARVEHEMSALRVVPKGAELVAERNRLLTLAKDLPALLAKATPEERRAILSTWVQEITLNKVTRKGQIKLRTVSTGLLANDSQVCPAT